jgi:hypothetical protein
MAAEVIAENAAWPLDGQQVTELKNAAMVEYRN